MSIGVPPTIAVLPDPPAPPSSIGLVAGGGRLPVLVAEGMKAAGHSVRCVGLTGMYEPSLADLCDEIREAPALRIGSWVHHLKAMGAQHAVMVGKVDKAAIMYSWRTIVRNRPDLRVVRAWFGARNDRRSNRLLAFVAEEMAKEGVHLIDSTTHITDHMAFEGPMTSRGLTSGQRTDAEFGWPLLRELLRLDIGQAIAVKDGDVIAVEAVEGTDRMIRRAGELCRKTGWILIKAARAGHDRRSDVPTIGRQTIELLHECGGRGIVLTAGDVIVLDRPETLALADKLGVAVHGISPA